jgi:hypothetical protein
MSEIVQIDAGSKAATHVILGAGVVGLTTALELKARLPAARIAVLARDLPGDSPPTYSSAWAGGNWLSCAVDNGPEEERDLVTYRKFERLARESPECGIKPMNLRTYYDNVVDEVDVLSEGTGKIWYDELVGGIKYLPKDKLPEGAVFGFDAQTFILDSQKYLPW